MANPLTRWQPTKFTKESKVPQAKLADSQNNYEGYLPNNLWIYIIISLCLERNINITLKISINSLKTLIYSDFLVNLNI